jgi:flagellar motor component MotA
VSELVELNDIEAFLRGSSRSVFRTHIESLFTIFREDHDIRQDALVELLHDRLLARNRLSELFSSILITLGLIGTIVGLIIMVGEMRKALQGFDPNGDVNIVGELMAEGGALAGLDTAFYTTLLGAVLGGVLLRVLTSVVESNITRYTAHIAELTEVNVLPAMRSTARGLLESGYYNRQG